MAQIESKFDWRRGESPDPEAQERHALIAKYILHCRFKWDVGEVVDWDESVAWAVSHLSGHWNNSETVAHRCPIGCCASREDALLKTKSAFDILVFRRQPRAITLGRFHGSESSLARWALGRVLHGALLGPVACTESLCYHAPHLASGEE